MEKGNLLNIFCQDVNICEIKISNINNEEKSKEIVFFLEFADEKDNFINRVTCIIPSIIAFSYQTNMMYLGVDTIVSIEKLPIEDLWVQEQLNLLYTKFESIMAYSIILSPASEIKLILSCDEIIILDCCRVRESL